MFYRETGDFKTSYSKDSALFPIKLDQIFVTLVLLVAFFVVPFGLDDYWSNAILVPMLCFMMAAVGLNILTGYCGQVSLGSGAFMAVGAYASYKLMTSFPEMNMIFVVLISGGITAAVGVFFGLPSLRIKGFYLAVATLAAQFFLVWLFNKFGWFFNYSPSGMINTPPRELFGYTITGPEKGPVITYLFALSFVVVFGFVASNLVRGRFGRSWMSIRDMDIAAEIIGVPPMATKLTAFAVSSFYIGMAGALYFTVKAGAVEVGDAFSITISFNILFMIIIGGLGSMLGSYIGAAFIYLMPIALKNIMVGSLGFGTATAEHFQFMLVGGLIMFFLIVEPHGLARLWAIAKEKLRLWPFPH